MLEPTSAMYQELSPDRLDWARQWALGAGLRRWALGAGARVQAGSTRRVVPPDLKVT